MRNPATPAFVSTLFIMFISSITFSQDLVPLAEHNQWMYERTVFESGEEVSKDTVRFIIEKPVIVNNVWWFISDHIGVKLMLRNTPIGQYELDSTEVDAFGNYRQFVVYKNPVKTKTLKYLLRNGGRVSVSDQLYPTETPVGNFSCYKYELRYPIKESPRIDTYICPGVGIIFTDMDIDGRLVQMKLMEYKLH